MFKLFTRQERGAPSARGEGRTREVAAAAGQGELKLHELDYQDVALTAEGARMVKSAARSVIDQYMPALDSAKITVREAMALFIDHVFWEENTGGLYMCTDVATRSVCLPIPSRCWSIRRSSMPVQ